MMRIILSLVALLGLVLPTQAGADPADINAAARGVVRVVIIGSDGSKVFPVSHGTGFAVTPTRIVTNAHVVDDAATNSTLRIGVVPSEGNDSSFARLVAISPRNDLALIEIVGDLRLPSLTISGDTDRDSGEVSAVGYPMNVDRAQGLDLNDILNSQPPVKSRGFLSGARPSRQFDTILHTASIARGNSGGPLLDGCGRVLGVNSFGAESGGSDAEFFFAVSTKELLPFLKANDVSARVNALPCRSLADLDEAERERLEAEQTAARTEMAARAEEQRSKRARVQLEAELAVQEERENAMAIAAVLFLLAAGCGAFAWSARSSSAEYEYDEDGDADGDENYSSARSGAEPKVIIGGTLAVLALVGGLAAWFTRPGLDAIDRRVNAEMAEGNGEEDDPAMTGSASGTGAMVCTLELDRSRITGTPNQTVEFAWGEDGCVNQRTQYGFKGGTWSRLFVPNEEDAVSVNRYDPDSKTFRTDRYLLSRSAMAKARAARGQYSPPKCGSDGAAGKLGDMQGAVTALLPENPNERLVYSCEVKGS
ncbi:S1 family peptidase [Pontixanthobacter aquaemixtae]|uniref:Trypsin-like serine protease n=1 Tax=Pontixanthobacter aquaemixtae TaxID=1958940 RepID=A0A844ZUV8_9SPHN|nr:serine protease [Pontixanthobacter aquaemixtae]MXO90746.1 trypsin-like serine protease [Pontixanthobacter aquaemixtae]